MATKPLTLAQLQAALKSTQAQAAATEAAARKSVTEATDTLSQLKLLATAASDRELKATADALRQQLASLQAQLRAPAEADGDLPAQISLLKTQIEGLQAENQRLAQQCDTAQAR